MEPIKPSVAEPDLGTEPSLIPMYKVLLHDDPVTPFLFVQALLMQVFRKDPEAAFKITSEVHETGIGLVVVEPLERAEFHCDQVRSLARGNGFPLTATYEVV